MTFTEMWFSPAACENLAALARQVLDLEGRIVEIGSWEGRSTIALANAVAPAVVHAVDTWDGSPGEPSWDLAHERDVFARFESNIVTTTRGNVEPHRMDWRDYFAADLSPCRFVFIDGEHTYEQVSATLETVVPLMVPGGIICGDDVHHLPVMQAVVDRFGPSVPWIANLWHLTLGDA